MKNMGLSDLRLVAPVLRRRPLGWAAETMAARGRDVLARARRHTTLYDAVGDAALVVGTTARRGALRREALSPRELAREILSVATQAPVAVLFGPENHGLTNRELACCQRLCTIPADPTYPSLNLAHAVIVCAYELWLAAGVGAPRLARVPASAARRGLLRRHLAAGLAAIGFLHGDQQGAVMASICRALDRAALDDREVDIFLGIARQMSWAAGKRHGGRP